MQSGLGALAFMTARSLRDNVCHPGHREGARPLSRPLTADRLPDRADDRPPVEEASKKNTSSALMDGVYLLARLSKTNHTASKLPTGRGSAVKTPGYLVGIELGYCSLSVMRTTSKAISNPGAKRRSVPVADDTTTRNSRLESQKEPPLETSKCANAYSLPLCLRDRKVCSAGVVGE